MSDPLGLFGDTSKDPLGLFDEEEDTPLLKPEWTKMMGDVGDSLVGAGQAAANVLSAGAAMPAGFVAAGLQKLNNPSGIDFEKQAAENMNRYTYEPTTEKGQEYADKVGQAFNDVGIPALAHIGGLHLPSIGEMATQIKAKGDIPKARNSVIAEIEAKKAGTSVAPKADPLGLFDDQGQQDFVGYPAEHEPGSINPYNVGGHVDALKRGEDTALDNGPQGELFGKVENPEEALVPEQQAADAEATQMKAQNSVDLRRIDMEDQVANQRRLDEEARVRAMGDAPMTPRDEASFANLQARAENQNKKPFRETPISSSGAFNRQRGALDPAVFKEGYRGLVKHLSALTDKLADDPVWQYGITKSLGDKEYLKNSDGSPMVLLHGTTADVKGPLRASNQGLHLGSPGSAHFFVQDALGKRGTKSTFSSRKIRPNSQIYPTVIKEGNYPYIKADAGDWTPSKIIGSMKNSQPYEIKKAVAEALEKKGNTPGEIAALFNYVYNKTSTKGANEAWTDVLKRAGIDGFFYENRAESPTAQKMFDNSGREDIPARREFIRNEMEHPKSFVTWDTSNVKNVFDTAPVEPPRNPFKGPGKSQAGAIRLPFGKKSAVDQLKKIEGLKSLTRMLKPDERPVPEIMKDVIAIKEKDVDQNVLQRLANHFTKGGLYQAIKTDNTVVKTVADKVRDADNHIKADTGAIVHDGLAPIAQALSKKEKADVWALQSYMESQGEKITPEFMQRHGFNEKQIAWVTEHSKVMDDILQRINKAQELGGKPPISARVAYIATRSRGDFRKLVYEGTNPQGQPKVVGIIGADTRLGLNKQVERLVKENPEYNVGEERYFGGRSKHGTQEGFSQMLEFLSENSPEMKKFVNSVNDLLSKDAYEYMNAKSHTMAKKGVFGTEGHKLYETAAKNAEDGMQAQLRYAETIIKWAHLSKAIDEVKPMLKADNGIDMPNAKSWAENYIQGALGNNPTALGRKLDGVFAEAGRTLGIGTSLPARTMATVKSYVNGLLLGFWNTGFLTMNLLQPVRTMPEMAAWIASKGVDVGVDLGLGRSLLTMTKELTGKGTLSSIEQGALKYAKENHVYSSNLFESGNRVSKDTGYYWNKGTQSIASGVERETRKLTYLAYVHMLDESGITPEKGLYQMAQNATDIHMNNYAASEAPKVYQEAGAIGKSAYNLMSFKHNELSRMAMLAREIPNNHVGTPLLINMLSTAVFAGVMGFTGYHEVDWVVQKISAMLGKPTSLTKILLDNPDISDYVKYGIGNVAGVDLTSRAGLQVTPGSIADAVAPGASKVGSIVQAGAKVVTQPNLYNAGTLAREATPNSVNGLWDRILFSSKNAKGDELSMNRNKVQANAVRNDADKLWKTLGMTGVNESKQKALEYANDTVTRAYMDKRKDIIDNATKVLFTSGKVPQDFATKYIAAQGDPKSLGKELTQMAMEQKVDQRTLGIIQNAMSQSLTSQHKLMRSLGKE